MYYSLANKTFLHIFYIFFHSSFWRCKKVCNILIFNRGGDKSLIFYYLQRLISEIT